MRLCIFASIFELLPLAQSSERALLLKVLITRSCKQLAYIGQAVWPCPHWIRLQRQFRLAAGVAAGIGLGWRGGRAHEAPADGGDLPCVLPDHDLGGAA